MATAPRELTELVTLLRVCEPDSTNLGEYVSAHADVLAGLLRSSVGELRGAEKLRDDEVAPRLRRRLEALGHESRDERLARLSEVARRGAVALGATARWTDYGAILDIEVLLRDVLADPTRKFIGFQEPGGFDVAIGHKTLKRVASLRRLHVDLVAYVHACGLSFRWKGGRGGFDWRPQVVEEVEALRVLVVPLRRRHQATARVRRGAWLGDVLRELGFPA
jgi:hypothetical protein